MESDWREASPSLVYLTSAGISEVSAQAWLGEISALRRECGCKLGAAFFLLAIAAMLTAAFCGARLTTTFVIAAILVPILSLGLGKWLGQFRARRLLARRVAEMRDAMARLGRRETADV